MKKWLAVLLSVLLLMTAIPLGAVSVVAAGDFAGGSGTEEDPYLVSTKAHLNNVRKDLSAHYKMTADIVFTDADFAPGGAFYGNSNGWEPIGSKDTPFTGSFDGGYYDIVGLKMDRTAAYVGLFGYMQDGTICNVRLRNADMKGGDYTGAICGYAQATSAGNAVIRQCYVDGTVEGNKYVGGICGNTESYNSSHTVLITECYNKANVTALTGYVGGILGQLYSYNTVSVCANEGAVTAPNKSNGYSGGIVGYLYNRSSVYVSNSYNKGDITGYYVGGIVGEAYYTAYIEKCYDIGTQTGKYPHAISYNNNRTSCYSLSEHGEEVLSDKRTFMDWNFETIWTMAGDLNYPYPELLCFTSATVNINGTVAYGETLTAYYLSGGAYPDTIVYEWYMDGVLVGQGDTYTITAADVGKYLTVRATATDAFGTSTVDSTLYMVEKAVQTAAPVLPEALHVTDNSFILSVQPGQEYSVDGETWQMVGTFSNLLPNHEYVVYVRMTENAVYAVGETVEALRVTTSRRPIVGVVSIVGTGFFGEVLTANVTGIVTPDATLSYEWVCGETVLGTGATYTVIQADISQTIAMRVSGSGDYTGTLTSAAIVAKKADNPTVAPVPVVLDQTGDTVTLLAMPGCEYSIDGVNWQSGNVFTDLQPVHTYTVYQRYAATATHNAGPRSEGTRATTTKNTVGAPSAPQMQSNTGTSITLVAVYGCQYSKDGINWQDSPTFTGLKPCSTYVFYQRYKETDTAFAGSASAATVASTLYTHEYDNVCDPTCNVCGEYRQVDAHVYDNACDEQCNICGMYRGVGGHVYDNDCDISCNECGAIRTVGDHVYSNVCDTDCNVCGGIREVGDHNYSDQITTAATCHADGVRTYTCLYCGVTYTEVIPATGNHVYDNACDPDCNACNSARVPADHVYANACDATCDVCGDLREVGYHVYDNGCDRICNICDAVRVVEGHVYTTADTVVATCGTSGVRTYTCSNCGDAYTEAVPATGAHVYDNGCDTTCNVCGTYRNVSHAYVGEVLIEATCGIDGMISYTCSNCGDVYVDVVPATGAHSYLNGCAAQCGACGLIRPVAHAYVGRVTVEATCNANGVIVYTCSNCGDYREEILSSTGVHAYDNGCDSTCNDCGFVRPGEDHIYDNKYDATCNACGAIREAEELPTTAPTFVMDSAIVYSGKTFTVAIRTKKNSGIVSFKLALTYDTDVLELVSVEEQDFANMSFSPLGNDPFILNWVDAVNPNNATNGVVALLTFRVKEGVTVSSTDLILSYNPEDVYDSEFNNVVFRMEQGTVQISNYLYGDVNGDNSVNNKDLGSLQQYLNDWGIAVSAAADVNGDGKINNKDLGALQHYLND